MADDVDDVLAILAHLGHDDFVTMGWSGGGPRSLAFGAVVLVCTVVVGMLLRRVLGEGTAVSFVVVATSVLAVLLLGWRLVARLVS